MLGVERVFASAVPTGLGMMKTEHGVMPIPGPAVVELLRGAPMYSKGVAAELTTPTGAAILAATVEGFGEMPPMRIENVGYGAGTHRLDFPNLLRILVGAAESAGGATGNASEQLVLETNVDDLNPELYEYVLERVFAAGAQDAWLVPIVMKKGRPAVTIRVLCAPDRESEMRQIIFRETGTLGIRSAAVSKTTLDRDTLKVETTHGAVAVKIGVLDGRVVTVAPEYEDCARVAREAGVPARTCTRRPFAWPDVSWTKGERGSREAQPPEGNARCRSARRERSRRPGRHRGRYRTSGSSSRRRRPSRKPPTTLGRP